MRNRIHVEVVEAFTRADMTSIARSDNFLKINTRVQAVKSIDFVDILGSIMKLRVKSATHPDIWYGVALRVLGPWDGESAESFRRALLYDRIAVRCSCPSFKYWGYAWILTANGSIVYRREYRFPAIRNPLLKGCICKHLLKVLETLPSWYFKTLD